MNRQLLGLLSAVVFGYSCSSQPEETRKPDVFDDQVSREDSILIMEQMDTLNSANHMDLMTLILGSPKYNIRKIGILIYDGVNELDVMGPRYVLGQAMGAKTQLIGIKPGPVRTVMGVQLLPDVVMDSVENLDILIVPGGFKGTIQAAYDPVIQEWIRKIDKTTQFTGAVCTGVWILGSTGLLEGKMASTNWYREEEFLKKYGAVPANERYTQDGKYWTSAGVTAGMDMSLAMLREIYGDRYAQAVMLDMEYDPNPPMEGGTPERSSWVVSWMMKAMYDAGVQPLVDSLEQAKK